MAVDLTVSEALADVRREIEAAQEQLRELRLQESFFLAALARHNRLASLPAAPDGSPQAVEPHRIQPDSADDPMARQWQALTLTDAVKRILADSLIPLSPSDVVQALGDRGRSDSNDAVRAALKHLKEKGVAVARTRSNWVLIGGSADPGPQDDDDERREDWAGFEDSHAREVAGGYSEEPPF